jgi:hypothetical protein
MVPTQGGAGIEQDGKMLFTGIEHIVPFAGELAKPVRIMVLQQSRN